MADPKYQEMIINSRAEDIVYTAAVSGVNANFLRPSLEAMGITEELKGQSKKIDFEASWMQQRQRHRQKTIWSAGQGVTSIADVKPTAALIDQLKEFKVALEEQHNNYKKYC